MLVGRASSAQLHSMGSMPKKRLVSRLFSVTYAKNHENALYIAVSISKKTAPLAVDRNRAKRRAREAIKEALLSHTKPVIGVVALNKAVLSVSFDELVAEFKRVLRLID